MADALWWYWWLRVNLSEGRHWLERALDIVADPALRLTLLHGASVLAFYQDDYASAGGRAQGIARTFVP